MPFSCNTQGVKGRRQLELRMSRPVSARSPGLCLHAVFKIANADYLIAF